MKQPELRAAKDLAVGDYLCVPGLPTVKFKISNIELGSPTTIISSGANLILPNPERELWSLKKEDVDA